MFYNQLTGMEKLQENMYTCRYTYYSGDRVMQASILDLRYKMKDVLKALDRNEIVQILYHGKLKGEIVPCRIKTKKSTKEHPFFGMNKKSDLSVSSEMKKLRGGRYNDL